MQYRRFGTLDWKPSALGFGCMRLPTLEDDSGKIDEPLAIAMVRKAIDADVNYIDTAWGYHREQSEPFVARALADGYRQKVRLATKLPSWLVKTTDDMDRLLDTQLERLQTDHIDFYLLHSMNRGYWERYQQLKVFDWAEAKMAEGKFNYLGFSFHDTFDVFKSILDGYDNWTFCQIQYNYMDVDEQAGLRGLQLAAERGLGVVIMEPLRGGRLANVLPPTPVAQAFARSRQERTPAEWALQWLWDQPEVSLLLSGMSTMQQVEQNVESASRSGVGTFSTEDHETIAAVQQAWRGLAPVPCTHCEYCLPCPNGVEIPSVFKIYNTAFMYDDRRSGRWEYTNQLAEAARATSCVECGICETLCPQTIPIIAELKNAHAWLMEAA